MNTSAFRTIPGETYRPPGRGIVMTPMTLIPAASPAAEILSDGMSALRIKRVFEDDSSEPDIDLTKFRMELRSPADRARRMAAERPTKRAKTFEVAQFECPETSLGATSDSDSPADGPTVSRPRTEQSIRLFSPSPRPPAGQLLCLPSCALTPVIADADQQKMARAMKAYHNIVVPRMELVSVPSTLARIFETPMGRLLLADLDAFIRAESTVATSGLALTNIMGYITTLCKAPQ